MKKEATLSELNTYAVTLHRYGEKIVQAKSRSAAKYQAYLDYDITGGLGFGAYVKWVESVRLLHKSRSSDYFGDVELFERTKAARGLPFAYQGQRIVLRSKSRGDLEGILCGANDSHNLNILFEGNTRTENCHPHYQLTYFAPNGEVAATFAN